MSHLAKEIASAGSIDDPKLAFENAIAHMQHRHGSEPIPAARTPIAIRQERALQCDPATEKRALTDAARALARLWNVVPNMVR